jgi:hypothetical protein
MERSDYAVWRHRDLRVFYRPELDGGGSTIAPPFVEFVRRRATGTYPVAYEWCAGPAFIGFTLLAEGVCDRLCLTDVNPAVADCLERTVEANGLSDRVTWYIGENLDALPDDARFDLVVANPPNFSALNPRHPRYELYRDDLRPNDPDWRLHRGFYDGIGAHLHRGAVLHISEVEPDRNRVFIPRSETEPYDVRPRPAIDDFVDMIGAGGLRYVDTVPYFTGADGAELFVMTSRSAS